MEFEKFKKLIDSTRCTRRYENNFKVKTEDLIDLIDIARLTSSANNIQPLKYIIVNDKEFFKIIHKPIKWAANLTEWNQKENEKPSAYILILQDRSLSDYPEIDLGIAAQTIMLGLTTKGLNGCILASIDKEHYKNALNLEDNLEPLVAISVGKGKEKVSLTSLHEGSTNYFRNDKDEHCVPKRSLEEVIVKIYE